MLKNDASFLVSLRDLWRGVGQAYPNVLERLRVERANTVKAISNPQRAANLEWLAGKLATLDELIESMEVAPNGNNVRR